MSLKGERIQIFLKLVRHFGVSGFCCKDQKQWYFVCIASFSIILPIETSVKKVVSVTDKPVFDNRYESLKIAAFVNFVS